MDDLLVLERLWAKVAWIYALVSGIEKMSVDFGHRYELEPDIF